MVWPVGVMDARELYFMRSASETTPTRLVWMRLTLVYKIFEVFSEVGFSREISFVGRLHLLHAVTSLGI